MPRSRKELEHYVRDNIRTESTQAGYSRFVPQKSPESDLLLTACHLSGQDLSNASQRQAFVANPTEHLLRGAWVTGVYPLLPCMTWTCPLRSGEISSQL